MLTSCSSAAPDAARRMGARRCRVIVVAMQRSSLAARVAMELRRSCCGASSEPGVPLELRRGCNGARPELQWSFAWSYRCCIGATPELQWSLLELRRSCNEALQELSVLR
ncbi:unnamed protein product [Triticum turgidum subsp. durum]|uniref:Uncharacterized protein n=1 Tax=Triticum turgidum subsp. durum TaxID=4567 RepID=A0A9R0UWM0_TRITD|nr:unnamed protein product [Triticum turgidum subsp. durum]